MDRDDGDLSAILKEGKGWRTLRRKLIILRCFVDRDNRKAYTGNLAKQFSNHFCYMKVWNKQNFLVARSLGIFIIDHRV